MEKTVKKPWLAAIAALVVVAIGAAVVLATGLLGGNDPAPGEVDTNVSSYEQLKALLAREEELDITLNADLEVPATMEVTGIKRVSGSGQLVVPLGIRDSVSIFNVKMGAELYLTGIKMDGSATGDGVSVDRGGKAELKDVTILWPYQYGVASYGAVKMENVVVDNAPVAAVLASGGSDVKVVGGQFLNSQSLSMYVENGGRLEVTGGAVLDGSAKHGITNRGTLVVSDAQIGGCEQYAIVNYDQLNIAYSGADSDGRIVLCNNGKGAIYNYADGVVDAQDMDIRDNIKSALSNSGKMEIRNSTVSGSGTNGVYNVAEFTATGLTIINSGNCGVYNMNPGALTMNSSSIQDSVKRGVHNKGGVITLNDVEIKTCGTHGVANTVDDYDHPGVLNAVGLSVSGCRTNIYNESAGVQTSVSNSVLYPSVRTNVVVSYGRMELDGVRILGSQEEKTYGLQIAKGADCVVSGSGEITGAASRGVTNHGTLHITGGYIHGNTSHASGGGVFTDGVLYVSGGEISGNTAATAGGGIGVGYSTTDSDLVGRLYLSGGRICDNTAATNGGGVYVSKGIAYEGVNNGEIQYCYAELTGGEIGGNTAMAGNGVMFAANASVGGALHLDQDSVLRISADVVLKVSPLSKHSASDPMRVSATGAEGTVVMKASSEENAKKVFAAIKSDSKSVAFERQGANIVLKAGEYVDVDDIDMTGAKTVEVNTFAQLKEAVESTASGEKKKIVVTADIRMLDTITVPVGAVVQINDNGQTRILLRDVSMNSGAFFNVPAGAVFGLRSTGTQTLVLDGNRDNVTVTAANSALLLSGGETHVLGAVLRNNYAEAKTLSGCYGGLIYVSDGIVNVKNAKLAGGSANNGGAIYINGGQVTLTDTEVSGCTSKASGGAIRYQGGSLTINGGSFTGNTGSVGGAIAADKGVTAKVTGTVFEGNKTSGGHGGAVYLTGSSVLGASNVTFKNNATGGNGSYYGGALGVNGSEAKLESCIFEGNTSDHAGTSNGGALYVSAEAKVHISGASRFVENKTSGNGGAIYGNKDSVVTLDSGVEFIGNKAKQGAVAYITGYTLKGSGIVVDGNQATASGGAFYVTSKGVLDMADSSFSDNVAATYGGVINAAKDTTVSFESCVFANNQASAGNHANTLMLSTGAVISLSDVTITSADPAVGDIRLHNTGTLKVADKVVLGTVYYADEASKVQVERVLTDGSALTVRPAAWVEGKQVIESADEEMLAQSVAYISVTPNGEEEWAVDARGCLCNNSMAAMIGEKPYKTLEEALSAAKTGETVKLLREITAESSVTVPADVTLNGAGFALNGDVLVEATGKVSSLKITGSLTAQGDLDMSTLCVDGKVETAANSCISMGAASVVKEIELGVDAQIELTEALGEQTIILRAQDAVVGTVLIKGDAALVASEYVKFNLVLDNSALCLGSDGTVKNRPFEATISGKEGSYDSLTAALADAQEGDTILVSYVFAADTPVTIDKKVTIQATEKGAVINRGTANTGAVFTVTSTGDLTLLGVTVDGCSVSAEAALINNMGSFTLGETATLRGGLSTVNAGGLDNQAGSTAVISGSICDCTGKNGGAVRNFGADADSGLAMAKLTVSDGALLESNVSNGTGGAIHQSGELTLGAATLKNNYAASHGGAINFSKNVAAVTVSGTIFDGNSSGGTYGGAVYISGSVSVTMENVKFIGKGQTTELAKNGGAIGVGKDAALTVKGEQTEFKDLAASTGGAIYGLDNCSITIENGSFRNNASTTGGGGVLVVSKGKASISGGSFTGNKAGSVGGVCNTSGAATITISGGSFTGNAAVKNGGAVHVSGSGTLKLSNGTISGNTDAHTPCVDIWLNNTSSAKMDLTAAQTGLSIGTVSGVGESNVTNPDGVTFDIYTAES